LTSLSSTKDREAGIVKAYPVLVNKNFSSDNQNTEKAVCVEIQDSYLVENYDERQPGLEKEQTNFGSSPEKESEADQTQEQAGEGQEIGKDHFVSSWTVDRIRSISRSPDRSIGKESSSDVTATASSTKQKPTSNEAPQEQAEQGDTKSVSSLAVATTTLPSTTASESTSTQTSPSEALVDWKRRRWAYRVEVPLETVSPAVNAAQSSPVRHPIHTFVVPIPKPASASSIALVKTEAGVQDREVTAGQYKVPITLVASSVPTNATSVKITSGPKATEAPAVAEPSSDSTGKAFEDQRDSGEDQGKARKWSPHPHDVNYTPGFEEGRTLSNDSHRPTTETAKFPHLSLHFENHVSAFRPPVATSVPVVVVGKPRDASAASSEEDAAAASSSSLLTSSEMASLLSSRPPLAAGLQNRRGTLAALPSHYHRDGGAGLLTSSSVTSSGPRGSPPMFALPSDGPFSNRHESNRARSGSFGEAWKR
jgi:hypothetical protein